MATPSLAEIASRLTAAGCVAAEAEAAELLSTTRDPVALAELVGRRARGEPLAWVVGSVTFCGLRISVTPGVYVPRPHTELLASRAAALLPPAGVAFDLCTGAGAVACVLSARHPRATVLASDTDALAVACARQNGVDARLGWLDEPLPVPRRGQVDVMTAVAPYVPSGHLHLLARDVLAFEPRAALDGGEDGLRLLSTVVARSVRWLRPGGWLLLELGGDQAAAVAGLMSAARFEDLRTLCDDDGDDRAVEGRWSPTGPAGPPARG